MVRMSRIRILSYGIILSSEIDPGESKNVPGSIEAISRETWEGYSGVRDLFSNANVWVLDNLKTLCRQW